MPLSKDALKTAFKNDDGNAIVREYTGEEINKLYYAGRNSTKEFPIPIICAAAANARNKILAAVLNQKGVNPNIGTGGFWDDTALINAVYYKNVIGALLLLSNEKVNKTLRNNRGIKSEDYFSKENNLIMKKAFKGEKLLMSDFSGAELLALAEFPVFASSKLSGLLDVYRQACMLKMQKEAELKELIDAIVREDGQAITRLLGPNSALQINNIVISPHVAGNDSFATSMLGLCIKLKKHKALAACLALPNANPNVLDETIFRATPLHLTICYPDLISALILLAHPSTSSEIKSKLTEVTALECALVEKNIAIIKVLTGDPLLPSDLTPEELAELQQFPEVARKFGLLTGMGPVQPVAPAQPAGIIHPEVIMPATPIRVASTASIASVDFNAAFVKLILGSAQQTEGHSLPRGVEHLFGKSCDTWRALSSNVKQSMLAFGLMTAVLYDKPALTQFFRSIGANPNRVLRFADPSVANQYPFSVMQERTAYTLLAANQYDKDRFEVLLRGLLGSERNMLDVMETGLDHSDLTAKTPLILAIDRENIAGVQMVLKYGADPYQEYQGKNAFAYAKSILPGNGLAAGEIFRLLERCMVVDLDDPIMRKKVEQDIFGAPTSAQEKLAYFERLNTSGGANPSALFDTQAILQPGDEDVGYPGSVPEIGCRPIAPKGATPSWAGEPDTLPAYMLDQQHLLGSRMPSYTPMATTVGQGEPVSADPTKVSEPAKAKEPEAVQTGVKHG